MTNIAIIGAAFLLLLLAVIISTCMLTKYRDKISKELASVHAGLVVLAACAGLLTLSELIIAVRNL